MFSLVGQVVAFSVLCCSFAAANHVTTAKTRTKHAVIADDDCPAGSQKRPYNEGSTIKFTPAKASFVPGGEEVALKCEVEESTVESNNVKDVMSITIYKVINGHPSQFIAAVTDYEPPSVSVDQKDVEVHGNVSGTTGMESYLSLKWTKPTLTLAGTYQCFIAVLAADDLTDSLSSFVQLFLGNGPSNEDFANIVQELSMEVKRLKESSEVEANIVQELSMEVKRLNESSEVKINNVEANTLAWQNNVASDLIEMKKIQSGIHDCGSSGYIAGDWWSSKEQIIYFQKAYKYAPSVQVSVQLVESDNTDHDDEFGVELLGVTKTNFTIRCKHWKGNKMYHLVASWMSAPKF